MRRVVCSRKCSLSDVRVVVQLFSGAKDRVTQLLSSGELSKLTTFRFELINVSLRWLLAHSPAREVTILHVLLQRGFWNIMSR